MRYPFKRILVTVIALALVVALAACGSNKTSGGGSAGKGYNQTDVAFVANMAPHHMAGVELGRLAASKGVNAKVKSIGQAIDTTQTSELGKLNGFLKTFGGAQPKMLPPVDERGMMDTKKLTATSGQDFDRTWLDVISAHHGAAIQMAQIEVAGGQYGPAKSLAKSIISTQSRELSEFNKLSTQLEK